MTDGERRELWITWVGGTSRGPNGTIVVGRDPTCDVTIQTDSGVSRRHAQLKLLPTAIKLQDLGSRNGTFVEGRRLTGAALLTGGELLRVGSTELRAYPSESALRQSLGSRRTQSYAPPGEIVETTVSTNVFGGLLRDIARATLSNPAEIDVLVAEACDTAQHMAMGGILSPPDAAIVADCAVREALRGQDARWLRRVFLMYSTARLPLPLDLARRIIRHRDEIPEFPEEELGGYIGVLAGISPGNAATREHVGKLFGLLTGEEAT